MAAPGKGTLNIYINGLGEAVNIIDGMTTFADFANVNTTMYTISDNKVMWHDGNQLYYNDVAVLPSDVVVKDGRYTTQSVQTISFKHRFKNDTLIGTGTYKFRRYSVEEPVATYTLEAGTYKWVDSPNLINIYQDLIYTSDGYNGTAIGVTTSKGGLITYVVTNGEVFAYNPGAGWTNDYQKITISTSQNVSYEFYNWAITGGNLVKQATPQLSAPANVSVVNGTASWEAVENATSYDILVDGTSIGTYTPSQNSN